MPVAVAYLQTPTRSPALAAGDEEAPADGDTTGIPGVRMRDCIEATRLGWWMGLLVEEGCIVRHAWCDNGGQVGGMERRGDEAYPKAAAHKFESVA